MTTSMSRTQKRSKWPDQLRIERLEEDADTSEEKIEELEANLYKEVASIRKLLIGLMVTISGGCVGVMITQVLVNRLWG